MNLKNKIKNVKGITLISLVITIIVLLILAGVALSLVLGENGILNRAKTAVEATKQAEAIEDIKLRINEAQTNAYAENNRKATLEDLLEVLEQATDKYKVALESGATSKLEGGITNPTDIANQSKIYVTNTTKYPDIEVEVTSNLTIKSKVENENNVEMTYVINSIEDDILQITVVAESDKKIEELITPDDIKINVNGKNKVGVDYQIQTGNEYIFKMKLQGEKDYRDYKLQETGNNKPIIIQNNSYAYPILSKYGTKINKNITIDYGDNTDNYYKIDDNTWLSYEGQINIEKNCTVKAKFKSNDYNIHKISSEDIILNLADNALSAEAYDNDKSSYTFISGGKQALIEIDSSLWGKEICLSADFRYAASEDWHQYIYFIDTSGTSTLYAEFQNNGVITTSYTDKKIVMPEGIKYINFKSGANTGYNCGITIYNIMPDYTPLININNAYPKLTIDGVEDEVYALAEITYYGAVDKKLYKINNGEWKEYYDTPVRVENGYTIEAKSIDIYGGETTIATQKVYINDYLAKNAYDDDGNSSVSISGGKQALIEIDSSLWGKEICLSADFTCAASDSWHQYIYFIDASGTSTLYAEFQNNGVTTKKYRNEKLLMPEGIKYIKFKSGENTNYGCGITIYDIRYNN